jgi:hypothetical protein
MKLIRNVFAAGLLAAVSVAACSSQHGATGSNGGSGNGNVLGNQGQDGVGQLSMDLDIGPGVALQTFNYTITGPNTYANTITIGDAQSLEFVVGGILAGGPYTLTISGTDTAGDICTGTTNGTGTSAPFTVVAGDVTQVTIAITCTVPPDASNLADVQQGAIEVDGSVVLVGTPNPTCPGISSFNISPAELAAGQSGALSLSDTDPTASILWTVTPAGGAVFGTGNTATSTASATTITCTNTASQVTVTATVTPADPTAAALCSGKSFTTMHALVNCEAPSGGFSCPPHFGDPTLTLACNADASTAFCANPLTDLNNCGSCGNVCPAAPAGSVETCSAGVCGSHVLPPTVCTAAPCAANQVTCGNNANGVCTPTEAPFVQLDLNSGAVSAAGDATLADPTTACFACLNNFGCVDNALAHVANKECEDFGATTYANATATVPAAATCDAVISCITGSAGAACASSGNGINFCYCGTGGGPSSQCQGANASAVNGNCINQEVAGFPYAKTDASDILSHYGTNADPSGRANNVFACAVSNSCSACLQ